MQSEESAVDKLVSTCTDWYDCSIKAIGGVWGKKSMSGSFERSSLGGTEAFTECQN